MATITLHPLLISVLMTVIKSAGSQPTHESVPTCCVCTSVTVIPGCPADPSGRCSDAICEVDRVCCSFGWDYLCAFEAENLCNATEAPTWDPTDFPTVNPTPSPFPTANVMSISDSIKHSEQPHTPAYDVCDPDLTVREAALDLGIISDSDSGMSDNEVRMTVVQDLALLSNEAMPHIALYTDPVLIGKIYNARTLLSMGQTQSQLQQTSTEDQRSAMVEVVNWEFNDVLTVAHLESTDEKELNCLSLSNCGAAKVCEADLSIRDAALDLGFYTTDEEMAPLSDDTVRETVIAELSNVCADPTLIEDMYSDEELIGKIYASQVLQSSGQSEAELKAMMTVAQRELITREIMAHYNMRTISAPFLMTSSDKDLSCLASC